MRYLRKKRYVACLKQVQKHASRDALAIDKSISTNTNLVNFRITTQVDRPHYDIKTAAIMEKQASDK